jgi:hypothetical protein
MKAHPHTNTQARQHAGAAMAGKDFVRLDGELYARIGASDRLPPFLMSLATDTDLWMFVASTGGLTAGRVDPDGAIFPYRTEDELYHAHHDSGPLTLVRVERDGETILWRPLAGDPVVETDLERNLYKSALGSSLVFEEIHRGLGLVFRARWAGCDEAGWVRTVTLENMGDQTVPAAVLDGLRNVLPYGAPLALHQQAPNLVDAYRKSEIDPESGLGIYSLTSAITDKAEAAESLRANVVWAWGLEDRRLHLSDAAVAAFRRGQVVPAEDLLNGGRGHFLLTTHLELAPGAPATWHVVADAGCDHVQVAALRSRLMEDGDEGARLEKGLRRAGESLRRIVGSADGLQMTADTAASVHHFANVLFNGMRGGVFARNHDIPTADFVDFLRTRNRPVADRRRSLLAAMPASMSVGDLLATASRSDDADFARLCHEYLPLYFGRRHGDPSRPWNRFAIKVRSRTGERVLNYQGNWRDIFQNWEALAASYPGFLPGIVAKFVNASTVDGYNPYRVTRDSVDWETVSADDPWSNIGYWGDHQVIYLLKLLEATERTAPGALEAMLGQAVFSYADVPYRIRPYADLVRDPRTTIDYDHDLADRIAARVERMGSDGRLVPGTDGGVRHVNLMEKLLVPVLAKLSNLVPDGGIWMNTQRPEWNDANNALGGGGLSVVTLCYLRRHLAFLADLFDRAPEAALLVSDEVVGWLRAIAGVLERRGGLLDGDALAEADRRALLDDLGEAFGAYRRAVYANGLGGCTNLAPAEAAAFCRGALRWVDWGIRANRRPDGLYHAYNVLDTSDGGARIIRLQEMLEGQVAVLSSGLPDAAEALDILERMHAGGLYRESERSFMLYPERPLPGFLARNSVPMEAAQAVPLVRDLLAARERSVITGDAQGTCRFHGDLRNADDLAAVLDELADQPEWRDRVGEGRAAVLDLFEQTFGHRSFTGRSGAMYAYEGLGCIYWHMVAKLLLAVQEISLRAEADGAPADVQDRLAAMYDRIRDGLGFTKSAEQYGAFPTDPYSHTPPAGGARQPGMTGQVKEEILTRLGELGVRMENGAVTFRPSLLHRAEFLKREAVFRCYDLGGQARSLKLEAGSLAFTVCQVLVVYELTDGEAKVKAVLSDGAVVEEAGDTLPASLASGLLARTGRIARIHVMVPEAVVRG